MKQFCLIFLMLSLAQIRAQQADLPLNSELYHYIDRLDIQGRTEQTIHTDLKPYGRGDVAEIFRTADTGNMNPRAKEWFQLNMRLGDDAYADSMQGKGVLKYFYKNKRDLYSLRKEGITLYVNPVLYTSLGGDQHNYDPAAGTVFLQNYRNSRGAQIRGTAFRKLGFFTEVIESQARYPQFVANTFNEQDVLWGEAFVKPFKGTGFDFFSARGYLTYKPHKVIRIKLGKDRAFWGNGYQSLQLSDYATDYFMLNITTRIWKLEYVNHFTQMVDYIRNKPDTYGTFPKKFAVFHQLAYKPTRNLSFSFFESIVYSPVLPGGARGFELEYLNPIIFYRSTEQFLGSPDNSLMGISGKVNFLKRFQGYGQIMLDDFNFGNRTQGTGYWGNKYGWQMGLKYIDVAGVSGLDLQLEYNRVRPYSYQHFNPSANYTHYGQYLAHSLGANVSDFNAIVRYQPFPRWSGMLVCSMAQKGLDSASVNFGGDPFKPYTQGRPFEYGHVTGQGVPLDITTIYGRISWRLFELDGYLDLEARYRKENEFTSLSAMGSLRLNIPNKPIKF